MHLHRLESGPEKKLSWGSIELRRYKGRWDIRTECCWRTLFVMRCWAAGLGDIGTHFPDTDPKWKGATACSFWNMRRSCWTEAIRDRARGCKCDYQRPKRAAFSEDARGAGKSIRRRSGKIHLKPRPTECGRPSDRGKLCGARRCYIGFSLNHRTLLPTIPVMIPGDHPTPRLPRHSFLGADVSRYSSWRGWWRQNLACATSLVRTRGFDAWRTCYGRAALVDLLGLVFYYDGREIISRVRAMWCCRAMREGSVRELALRLLDGAG